MVIMAIDQLLNTVAMKKVNDQQLLDILTEFNYDIDNLCAHIKIKGDQIFFNNQDRLEQVFINYGHFCNSSLILDSNFGGLQANRSKVKSKL